MTLRNFGVKSLQELADRLGELGLTLITSGEHLTDSTEEEDEPGRTAINTTWI